MFPFPTSLVPYTTIIKLVAILAVVAAIFGFGYKVGSDHDHVQMQAQLDKVQKQWDADKLQWKTTLLKQANDALLTLQAAEKRNADELKAKQDQIDAANLKAQQVQKANDHERQVLLDKINHPVAPGSAPADLGADGLWVDADIGTCTSDQDDSSILSKASGGGPLTGLYRCRLSIGTAERLVARAAEANEIVKRYNLCVDTVKVFQQQTASQTTTTVIDNQDGKGPDLDAVNGSK